MGKMCNIIFKVGEQHISGQRGTGSQTQLWDIAGSIMTDGIFAFIQKEKSLFYLLKKKFAVRGQSYTPGPPFKRVSRFCSSFWIALLMAGWLI